MLRIVLCTKIYEEAKIFVVIHIKPFLIEFTERKEVIACYDK